MTMELLPQEVHLLSVRWGSADHVPSRSISAAELRDFYAASLTTTIASWLAGGLAAWQSGGLKRQYAFGPVAWLIGTRREDDSYLDSLADLGTALAEYDDPGFRPPLDDADDEPDTVELGTPFANASAQAVLMLARRLSAGPKARQELVTALRDGLILVQRMRPSKVTNPLLASWNLLFGSAPRRAALFPDVREVVHLQHAFLRALYPAMHVGQDRAMFTLILTDFGQSIANVPVAGMLVDDFEQCLVRLGLDSLVSPRRLADREPERATAPPADSALPEGAPERWQKTLRPRARVPETAP